MRIFPTDKNQIKKDDMRKMFFILMTGILLAACGTPAKVLTSDEIRTMTTRIIQADYDMTFTSALSLLQSEGKCHRSLYNESRIPHHQVERPADRGETHHVSRKHKHIYR